MLNMMNHLLTFYKNGHYLFFIKMIYNHIDEIIDKYGVSKGKTIFIS